MDEFNKLYEVLNPAQKHAVDCIDGPVMVIAGPGTGKTTILTLRIANILKETDTAPDSILALTFTESGAYAMRRKLVEIIGPAAYKVNIQTFHGFAESIIQKYPDYFPRIIGSKIITDAEQIKITEKLIDSKLIKILRPYGDPTYYVRPVLSEIQILKRENVSPSEFKKSIERDLADLNDVGSGQGKNMELRIRNFEIRDKKIVVSGKDLKRDKILKSSGKDKALSMAEIEKLKKRNEKNLELAYLYGKYEKQLAEDRFYDFDDMLLELIRAMEENYLFKLMLQETYQYILADEHQDANASQNRILELLADFDESPNLFIVGDDKQAIYRFQGASLDNFLFFSRKYKQAKVIDLEHNYRSHQGILDASHSLIANNPGIEGRERTRLISLQIGSKPIFIDELPAANDELEYVATIIERLLKKGEKPEEIAILYRENKEADRIAAALKVHGVPYRIES
ncbi:MAG: ATP-dependent helicase, partial [Candidatus Taylorbacteria bacterium]|nr:ATP-dependent helicase [Candidatus Taylorbacteria bacterium]